MFEVNFKQFVLQLSYPYFPSPRIKFLVSKPNGTLIINNSSRICYYICTFENLQCTK